MKSQQQILLCISRAAMEKLLKQSMRKASHNPVELKIIQHIHSNPINGRTNYYLDLRFSCHGCKKKSA